MTIPANLDMNTTIRQDSSQRHCQVTALEINDCSERKGNDKSFGWLRAVPAVFKIETLTKSPKNSLNL